MDLPLPDGAQQHQKLGLAKLQVDPTERVHVDLAHVIDLRDPASLEDKREIGWCLGGCWRCRCGHGPAPRRCPLMARNFKNIIDSDW